MDTAASMRLSIASANVCNNSKKAIYNLHPPSGSVRPSALQIPIECTGTVTKIRFRFPRSFEHIIPTPFDKVLNNQGTTTLTRVMVKLILNFILTQLIRSRTKRWNVSSGGLKAIIANNGLEL